MESVRKRIALKVFVEMTERKFPVRFQRVARGTTLEHRSTASMVNIIQETDMKTRIRQILLASYLFRIENRKSR